MAIDLKQAMAIAQKLKRETRNPDIVALCDWVMTPSGHRQCGETSYRDYMREYMREWRKRKKT